MRKLNVNKKGINTLENINGSCACIAYCGGTSFNRDEYKKIQMNTAHAGDPGPFSINEEV